MIHKWAASWQNQQNDLCAKRRLRSAWASAYSDESLRCPHEETLGPQLPIERTAKTLITLGGCPDWSESSLGAQIILLVLSWGGSNINSYHKLVEFKVAGIGHAVFSAIIDLLKAWAGEWNPLVMLSEGIIPMWFFFPMWEAVVIA